MGKRNRFSRETCPFRRRDRTTIAALEARKFNERRLTKTGLRSVPSVQPHFFKTIKITVDPNVVSCVEQDLYHVEERAKVNMEESMHKDGGNESVSPAFLEAGRVCALQWLNEMNTVP